MKRSSKPSRAFFGSLWLLVTACGQPLIETSMESVNDTDSFTITVNTAAGNKGLKDFDGPVFVHLGLITDSSVNPQQWRYVKFKWGSAQKEAAATKLGKNSWSYSVPGIRNFFGVASSEKVYKLAVLFREGNCFDTLCKTLRNEDRSDLFIPVQNEK